VTAAVHFKIVNDFGLYSDTNAACGNNFRRKKQLTDDPALVTCRECLTLCGFEDARIEERDLGDGWNRIAA
jgi:hypothetical protein